MDFEVGGAGEVPNPTRPEQWAPWEPRVSQKDAHNYETVLGFVSWELDCTPVPLCFSKSEIQNPNPQTSQDL